MNKPLIKFLATGFGVGFVPRISGTVGSLWGVLIFYLLRNESRIWLVISALMASVIAVYLCGLGEMAFGKKDCRHIVLDEVAGQLVTYLLIPYSTVNLLIGFAMFRFFDIVKIFPANWAQKNLPGGWGVFGDDFAAGIQAGAILYIIDILVRVYT